MANKYFWNKKKYVDILRGRPDLNMPALRSVAYGFDADDGYNIAKFAEWTPYQKKKVRIFANRIAVLKAQPKREMFAHGENLAKLQKVFHGGVPSKEFKVVFVPDPEHLPSLPGAKRKPPKIRVIKSGIVMERKGQFERTFIAFDQKKLARNARKEVDRVTDQMPDKNLYYIKCGEYESLSGKSASLLAEQVIKWMNKYDGKKPLAKVSSNSKHRWDDPMQHHWSRWLDGIIGYKMPKRGNIRNLIRMIAEGRAENKKVVHRRKLFMRRKGR